MWKRNRPGLVLLTVLVMAGCLTAVPSAASGDEWIENTGDILQIALPIIGGGSTFFTNPDPDKMWDKEGTKQFAYSFGSAWTTTYALKLLASKARPNGNNRTSFPSGHTMSAFSGASFIDGRYGKLVGIPAYLLAGFTGYSRVHSEWHYQDDVIAGASIGMMYSWHFVTPQPGKFAILPTVGAQGIGFQVAIGAGNGEEPDPEAESEPRSAGYDFAFGPAFALSNVSGSPGNRTFQLTDLNGNNDPTTTAAVSVLIPVSNRGRILVSYGPFEARDEGSFAYDVDFGGTHFPAGTEVHSAWRFYDLRAQYEYGILDNKHWAVRIGAGVGSTYSYTALQTADASSSALVDDTVYYPYGHLSLDYKFNERFSLTVLGEGIAMSDEWYIDTGAYVNYRAARAWDFLMGYTYMARQISTDTYYNKMRYGVPTLSVTRYW